MDFTITYGGRNYLRYLFAYPVRCPNELLSRQASVALIEALSKSDPDFKTQASNILKKARYH